MTFKCNFRMLTLISIAVLLFPASSRADDLSNTELSKPIPGLKECSIKIGEIPKIDSKPGLSDSFVRPTRWAKRFLLSRPNESQIVAIVELSYENKITFNPESGYLYGVIPKLSEITKDDADVLWGKNWSNIANSQVRQYFLLDSESKDQIILEVRFGDDQKVDAFRIFSNEVRNQNWQELKKKQGGVSSSL